MLQALAPLIAPIISDVVQRVLPASSDKKAEIEREARLALLEHADSIEQIRGRIVLEEAKSQHWMTATWRPALMWIAIIIISVNFLVFPIIGIFYPQIMENVLPLPPELWQLLTLGVGGYIVGRSGEKMIDKWKEPK